MVITDSFHSDIEGKNYKFGTPNKLNKTSKPLILFYFVQDYKRTWDEANPLNYDDPQLKNDAIVTKIESEGDVLNISLFDYESLDETELRFEVGKETSISKVVDENDHTKEYKFIPTKIVVDDSLEKGSKIYDELIETVWTNYYIKNSKEGEKIPKVAENVENLAAEGHSHNKSSYKKCAECSDSVFELEEEICFECSSFGAEYEKTDDERILGIHNGNGNKVGTVSIEDVSDNKDKVFISIDGYNEEDEHGWHPMIWDGVIPESPFLAETFDAEHRILSYVDGHAITILMTDDEATIDNAEEIIDNLVDEHGFDDYYEVGEGDKEITIYFKDVGGNTLRTLSYDVKGNKANDAIIEWFHGYDYPVGGYTANAETFEANMWEADYTKGYTDTTQKIEYEDKWGKPKEVIVQGLSGYAGNCPSCSKRINFPIDSSGLYCYDCQVYLRPSKRTGMDKTLQYDAETFGAESEMDCREAKEEVKKLRRKIALLDKLYDKDNALHHEILGSGGFFKEHELKGLFSEKDLENYEYWS